MTTGMKTCRVLLWLFVIVCGFELGGAMYEIRVMIPRWAAAPPQSVWDLYHVEQMYPQFATNGARFFLIFTPALGLLSLLTLGACFATRGLHRNPLLAATALVIAIVVTTFVYYVPNLIAIRSGAPGLSGPEIVRLVRTWTALNWLRLVLLVLAWLCALRALTLSPAQTNT